jgi:hypothetical protein
MKLHLPVVGIFLLIIGACIPAASPIPVPSATVPATLEGSPTSTQTSTQLPTGTPTLTATTQPSETQPSVLIPTFPAPSATVRPTRTRSALPTSTQIPTMLATGTPAATTELQATGTAPPTTRSCPVPTPELLWVDPVTSPTDQLSQVIVVHIGNGEEVTIDTESGRFTVTGVFGPYGNPASVEIALLPNTVHHLGVFARVRTILAGDGCVYGGYTLQTTVDSQGAPLTIVQE